MTDRFGLSGGSTFMDKHEILQEDYEAAREEDTAPKRSGPLLTADDLRRHEEKCRHLCCCYECERGLPHHTKEMLCRWCVAELERDLAKFAEIKAARAAALASEQNTPAAALPGSEGHAATKAASRPAQSAKPHTSAEAGRATPSDEALAAAHGTDPDWTLREIKRAKGATE